MNWNSFGLMTQLIMLTFLKVSKSVICLKPIILSTAEKWSDVEEGIFSTEDNKMSAVRGVEKGKLE